MLISSVNEMINGTGIQSGGSTLGWKGKQGDKWTRFKDISSDIDSQLKKISLFRALPNALQEFTNYSNMLTNDKYE